MIGVKSRWIQIFLSCAFLGSIAATALVDYVMSTPVTDAIQGGFFVAIFMTGAIFGGGALVFKEYTEGFACLLGGFCFSMWLLTLQPGGLIASSGGKGVFIGIFCVAVWALSWFQYTRPYALIGSISFSGATAFTLGVDCFTRAGLKEFWFYIWNLNDDLFPLNTNTFPLTRGIKVEIAVIVIGTIIGLLSQLKLWKVIRSKEREREIVDEEGSRQREAVEAALGRHLQRQNEREKSEWERQYGDRLASKRNTVLWQDAHPEKRYSTVSVFQLDQGTPDRSSEDLEMNAFGAKKSESAYGSKNKRQSTLTVDVIEEVDEEPDTSASMQRLKALQALERTRSSLSGTERKHSGDSLETRSVGGASKGGSADQDVSNAPANKVGDSSKSKRHSQQSSSRRSKHLSSNYYSNSNSQEHLIDTERPHSRASSAAATIDMENEELDVNVLGVELDRDMPSPPEIIISPVTGSEPATSVVFNAVTTPIGRSSTSSSAVGNNLEGESLLNGPDLLPKHETTGLNSSSQTENEESVENEEAKKAQSHGSEGASSSVDSLTKTALATIPSQMSSVVLSYRTNEWAKHITVAEEPIYDEPESIDGVDNELATQLIPVLQESEKLPARDPTVEVPPAAEDLPPNVKSSGGGVGIAPKPVVAQRSFSDQERRRSAPMAPSRSQSTQSLKQSSGSSRNNRTSLNPAMQHSLVATPIDENTPMEFTSPKRSSRRVSAPYMMPDRNNSYSRPQTAYNVSPYASSPDLVQMTRPSTQQNHRPGLSSVTRMASFDSHQPTQRDLRTDAQKRESLLAEWRLSQQQKAASTGLSGAMAEQGRAQMRAEKENQKLAEQYQRTTNQRKQQAMDQMMRRPDMQELHREAMRKMQAGANRKLHPTSE